MYRYGLLILFCAIGFSWSFGQIDSSTIEVPEKEKTNLFKRIKSSWPNPYPNPTRAGVYSLILPSAGQIYNKRYWKAPLVWAAVGGGFWLLNRNQNLENCYQDVLEEILLTGQPVVPACRTQSIRTSDQAKLARDTFSKNKQLSYVAIVAAWALQALEAYTDAHLKSFDINDDLGFEINLEPALSVHSGVGLSLTIQFP